MNSKYCSTCLTYQKTCNIHKSEGLSYTPSTLSPHLPKGVTMEIFGPLIKSSHQYILVVCNFATCFPLHTITAPAVLHAFTQLFSRVGIPDEILTDQETNFTSRLGITAIRTTPYHPQTDCTVEWFNQALKRMLQKTVDDTGKDWDSWLPFLLFAYWEVPQASTGFSTV